MEAFLQIRVHILVEVDLIETEKAEIERTITGDLSMLVELISRR